jgi:hypothetical protein
LGRIRSYRTRSSNPNHCERRFLRQVAELAASQFCRLLVRLHLIPKTLQQKTNR